MSDKSIDLAARAASGDHRAVESLLERHVEGLVPYLARRAGRLLLARETPEDLAQSICREVLEHGPQYRFEDDDAFRRWLYATALRKIKDRYRYHRSGKRDAMRDADATVGGVAEQDTPSRVAADREGLDRILRAIDDLPARDRELVLMSRVEKLSHADMAERLEITESHSRTLLARAMVKVTRRVADLED